MTEKPQETKTSLINKATTENVVALIIAIGVTGAAIYYANWDILSMEVGAVMGYLYSKKAKTEAS